MCKHLSEIFFTRAVFKTLYSKLVCVLCKLKVRKLGNSTSPRLTNVRRPKDISTIEVNGVLVVVANGKGVSLSTRE